MHLSLFQRCLLLQTLPSSLHLHLQVSCYSMCLVSLVLDIKLTTLTFKFFTTSETHSFAYGSLILWQLPVHLLILILKGKKTGSLPLALTTCGLTLHSRLFIEIQLNEIQLTPVKVDKNINPIKKHFLINQTFYTILYVIYKHQIFMSVWYTNSRNCNLINTKILIYFRFFVLSSPAFWNVS